VTGNTVLADQAGLDLDTVGGSATIQGNSIIADGNGVKLKGVLGLVQIGGTGSGQANTITAGQAGMLLLANGVMGITTVENNVIFANTAGIDFEDGAADFTARGNEIVAGASAGIRVTHSTSGQIVIRGSNPAGQNP